ncbi:hypothetical protein GCM10007063_05930 [Lentibacillus kapialis]|uniref:Uncharacterized protein n=1 Tax=Lentibacillus kapialis TaxID=340214 RepID=A0A917PNI8_9BACI|nr:hypothetical protein [Lentibacillus kapialis]GGJ86247.1 hypothetical protein GCM10007063_05930 [Lentibacillus kapialis]
MQIGIIANKCEANDLDFEYKAVTSGVFVYDDSTLVCYGYMDKFSSQELELMSYKIDWYMSGHEPANHIQVNRTTEYERKMKEVGHKQSDFL